MVDDDDDNNDPGGGDIDLLVPRAFTSVRPRRDDADDNNKRELTAFSWERLRRRHVVVRTNGFTVRGLLHGIDEDSLYLRGELRWWVLPMTTVTSVVRDPERVDDDHDDDDGDGDV